MDRARYSCHNFTMDLASHARLFNSIAFAYRFFFSWQVKGYTKLLDTYIDLLNVPSRATVLDIGCGTGAFAFSFMKKGFTVTGVDIAENMVKQGKKAGLDCRKANVQEGLPFEDNSFDIVTAAYVAHGLHSGLRESLFYEAKRLTKGRVLFQDYLSPGGPLVQLVERLEGGDYYGFLNHGIDEMKAQFSKVQVLPLKGGAGWYICSP